DVLAETMGDVFPEIRARKQHVQETIRIEEEAFNKTLDRGIEIFEIFVELHGALQDLLDFAEPRLPRIKGVLVKPPSTITLSDLQSVESDINQISVRVSNVSVYQE